MYVKQIKTIFFLESIIVVLFRIDIKDNRSISMLVGNFKCFSWQHEIDKCQLNEIQCCHCGKFVASSSGFHEVISGKKNIETK